MNKIQTNNCCSNIISFCSIIPNTFYLNTLELSEKNLHPVDKYIMLNKILTLLWQKKIFLEYNMKNL